MKNKIELEEVMLSSEKADKQIANEERYYYNSEEFKKLPTPLKVCLHKNMVLLSLGMTVDEAVNIGEFEFTFDRDKATQFEYWTNTKRTKGYKCYDISSGNLTVDMFL